MATSPQKPKPDLPAVLRVLAQQGVEAQTTIRAAIALLDQKRVEDATRVLKDYEMSRRRAAEKENRT